MKLDFRWLPVAVISAIPVALIALAPTPSDACSIADPCEAMTSDDTLGSGVVELSIGDSEAVAPDFLAGSGNLVINGNGRILSFELGDRTFELEVAQ